MLSRPRRPSTGREERRRVQGERRGRRRVADASRDANRRGPFSDGHKCENRGMRSIAAALLLGTGSLCGCASVSTPAHGVDAIVARYHENGRFSGSVLVSRGKTIVYQGAFGL